MVGGGLYVVEGLSLNGMVLSLSQCHPLTLISTNSLVLAVCDPPAPAAGHICRHDGFYLQGPPTPNATVAHCPLFRHLLQSDLAAQWCATVG